MNEPTIESLVDELTEATRNDDPNEVLRISQQITTLREQQWREEALERVAVIPFGWESASVMRIDVHGFTMVAEMYRDDTSVYGLNVGQPYAICALDEVKSVKMVYVIDWEVLSHGPDRRFLLVPVDAGEKAIRQIEGWDRDLSFPANDTHREVFEALAKAYRDPV